MKTLRIGSVLIAATLVVSSLQAQTIDEIVSKHINALGGKAVLSSVKSVYIESSVDVMGNEAPSVTYIVSGKGYRNELDFGGQKIIQCVTDKGGWAVNPMAGQSTPTAIPDAQVKASQPQLQIGGPLMDYASKGYKVELIGKDTTGGNLIYKLKLTTSDGTEMTYFIDSKTYYINKAINKVNAGGQQQEVEVTFSDYKKLDNGYVMAYNQSIVLPQVTLNITHKKIEINKQIDPALFEMPKN